MVVKCDNCCKEVKKRPCDIKNNKNVFCNAECHNDFRRKKMYDKLTKKVGKDFKNWLEEKYCEEELSTRQISKLLYGKSTNSPNVLTWLEKMGIPSRERSEAVVLQWKDNQERRGAQSKELSKRLTGKPSLRRRSEKSLEKDLNSYGFILNELFIKDGYTYFDCECEVCGYQTIKSLRSLYLGRSCKQCSIEKRTFADQTTVKAQRSKLKPWRKAVLERDDYICQCCGEEENLVAHHIECFAKNEALRFEVYNGITLCESCHREFHNYYGYGDNNLFQFSQFEQIKTTLNPSD